MLAGPAAMTAPAFRLRPRLARRLAWVLLAAVLAVQVLAWLHRSAHLPVAHEVQVSAATLLFGDSHKGAEDCELFDHACQLAGPGPASSPALLTPSVSSTALRFHPGWQLASQAAGFLARGPPRVI